LKNLTSNALILRIAKEEDNPNISVWTQMRPWCPRFCMGMKKARKESSARRFWRQADSRRLSRDRTGCNARWSMPSRSAWPASYDNLMGSLLTGRGYSRP